MNLSGWQRQEPALSEVEWAEGFADGGWAKTIGKLTLAAATQGFEVYFLRRRESSHAAAFLDPRLRGGDRRISTHISFRQTL